MDQNSLWSVGLMKVPGKAPSCHWGSQDKTLRPATAELYFVWLFPRLVTLNLSHKEDTLHFSWPMWSSCHWVRRVFICRSQLMYFPKSTTSQERYLGFSLKSLTFRHSTHQFFLVIVSFLRWRQICRIDSNLMQRMQAAEPLPQSPFVAHVLLSEPALQAQCLFWSCLGLEVNPKCFN